MKNRLCVTATAALMISACQNASVPSAAAEPQTELEIADCVRAIMTLDEGLWAYTGTIARVNGKFRTYVTTSEHKSAGVDMWSARSYGGDVEEDAATAEASIVKLIGTAITPIEDGVPNPDDAVTYTACRGPDPEGRYEATQRYSLPYTDDKRLSVTSTLWQSAHGSYFAEDIFDDTGRIIARRSGVNTPLEP